ncbi:MAG: glycosyltransferase family 2 protein [Armatimonadota bacterium]|nr:glycosyltransferase family 2 protein [Armatimonadota bacterium]
MSNVSAIIPAFNEADTIAATVAAVRRISAVTEIVVVDDGSPDNTAEEARKAGADKVIRLQRNLGKGGALMAGVAAARAGVLVFLDGDLGDSASHSLPLIQAVVSDETDMSIALLPAPAKAGGKSGGFGLVLRLARWGIRRLTGRTMKAPLSGQRAMKREVIERVKKLDRGFGIEVGLTVDALRAGWRIEEIAVPLTHRATGRDVSGFLHRGRQFLDVLLALARRI